MNIRAFKDINDPDLVCHWKRIVKEYDYFPQSSYGWCAPWWRLQSGKRELYIVTVIDENNEITGIAPLCIERFLGVKILRSFPIHFGDFYTFIVIRDDGYQAIIEGIVDHLLSFSHWDIVRLDQMNSQDPCYESLLTRGLKPKKLTDVIIANFEGSSFEEYLQGLSKNRRQILRKKRRRLERDAEVELVLASNLHQYSMYFEETKRLYDARWADDHRPLPTDQRYVCRNEAVAACFSQGQMILYILKADSNVIAFHLGFVHKNTFYTWRESHDPAYAYYSPGELIRGYLIEDLINQGVDRINFMAGGYDYKFSLAKKGILTSNYAFFAAKQSFKNLLLLQYYLRWRDMAKSLYYTMTKDARLRRLSRSIRKWL